MTGEEIRVPPAAYVEAEGAARDVTRANADEYGRAGMHVGVRWGGIAELSNLLADLETHHGGDDPVTVKVRERIAELVDQRSLPGHFSFRGEALDEMRAGWEAAKHLGEYPVAELLRETVIAFGGGLGYSWGFVDAARTVAKDAARRAQS